MALTLIRRKNKVGTLEIEATLSEQHSMTATVSKFPVEGGAIVSDHIVNDPEKVSLECFISNTPIGKDSGNFAQDAFDQLKKLWEARELLDIVTQYKVYSDMAIIDISVPLNNKTGQAIQFTIDLIKIKKVQATSVTVYSQSLSPAVADQASTSLNLGPKTYTPASNTYKQLAEEKLLEHKQGAA